MKKKLSFLLLHICLLSIAINTTAQSKYKADSLTSGVRKYVARNFSEVRTVNLYWDHKFNHDYTLKKDGKEIENGRAKDIQTINFSFTVPVLLLKNLSVYANGKYNSYQFDAFTDSDKKESALFTKNDGGYNYYEGSIAGTYRLKIANKPVLLMASVVGDGWNDGFEKVSGIFSAIAILKQSRTSSFSVGLYGTTLFDKIPVVPIVAYTHQFTPNLGVDVTLPSRAYLRYQFANSHRLSAGASLNSEQFYMETNVEGLPETSFFRKTMIRPELVYEYIINNHFYLNARGGFSKVVSGGFYDTNRKELDGDFKYTEPITPFFNLGISYNIF